MSKNNGSVYVVINGVQYVVPSEVLDKINSPDTGMQQKTQLRESGNGTREVKITLGELQKLLED